MSLALFFSTLIAAQGIVVAYLIVVFLLKREIEKYKKIDPDYVIKSNFFSIGLSGLSELINTVSRSEFPTVRIRLLSRFALTLMILSAISVIAVVSLQIFS